MDMYMLCTTWKSKSFYKLIWGGSTWAWFRVVCNSSYLALVVQDSLRLLEHQTVAIRLFWLLADNAIPVLLFPLYNPVFLASPWLQQTPTLTNEFKGIVAWDNNTSWNTLRQQRELNQRTCASTVTNNNRVSILPRFGRHWRDYSHANVICNLLTLLLIVCQTTPALVWTRECFASPTPVASNSVVKQTSFTPPASLAPCINYKSRYRNTHKMFIHRDPH